MRGTGTVTPIRKTQWCSFCGRDFAAVEELIAGPGNVAICDMCVEESARLIAARRRERGACALPEDRAP